MDWQKYWNQKPTIFEETEFLKQVDKTVSGQPITQEELEAQVSDVHKALNLCKDDIVLDLCCGNGIMTTMISDMCHSVVGLDYSEPLIRIAKKYNNPPNVSYFCMSVTDERITTIASIPFNKIYMIGSLQYFDVDELPDILKLLKRVSTSNSMIFFEGVPDLDKIWNFYNTEERREAYKIRKKNNEDVIGTWWNQKEIIDICQMYGFECEILVPNQLLNLAHYRFDLCLTQRQIHNGRISELF